MTHDAGALLYRLHNRNIERRYTNMLNGRRAGTLTAGTVLIATGVMFLLRIFIPCINYRLILSFWPVIFILLGIEIIAAYIINKDNKVKYDAAAIVLTIIMVFFAMGLACCDFVISHATNFGGCLRIN